MSSVQWLLLYKTEEIIYDFEFLICMLEAVLLILERDNKILFAKRHPQKASLPGRWSLPSDKKGIFESISDCARRCAKHELGLDIAVQGVLCQYHFNNDTEEKNLTFVKAKYDNEPVICAEYELTELQTSTFEDFFRKYKDEEIGHGLQYLRKRFYS
jgi:ADP-ribose pyrophosphatase YjhB (NUDIX family)